MLCNNLLFYYVRCVWFNCIIMSCDMLYSQTPLISSIADLFPFTEFFSNAPQPIFHERTYEEDWEIAEGCFRHLKLIFTQLDVSWGGGLFVMWMDMVAKLLSIEKFTYVIGGHFFICLYISGVPCIGTITWWSR